MHHKHFGDNHIRMQQYAKQMQVEEYRNLYAEKKKYLSSNKVMSYNLFVRESVLP